VIRAVVVACVAWLVGALGSAAHAAPITIGLFAPSAPFPSTAARVELANQLGAELGKALNVSGSGRVYARAADFAAAVKKGEITLALVDPAYLAGAGGTFTVIAASLSADAKVDRAWQLVARTGTKIADLQGKRVLVPSLGGREADFVLDVLLGGDVGRDFFAKIEAAPDTASALAALGLGKVEAVVVPATGVLPAQTAELLRLPASSGSPAPLTLPNPVLVVCGGTLTPGERQAVLDAAKGFKGDATITGFSAADHEIVASVMRRFGTPVKHGPFLVPAARLVVGGLLEGRTFAIERTPATAFAIVPTAR
jgi:hypothetical protein